MRSVRKPGWKARLLACGAAFLALRVGTPALAQEKLGVSLELAVLAPAARETALTTLAARGVTGVRLHLDWRRVQPAPGKFIWAQDDAAVAAARAHGLAVTLVLGPTAPWAVDPAAGLTPEQACCSVPKSPAPWEAYVRAAAVHYRGRVRTWQIRDQPNVRNFRAAVPEYFALLTAAARVLRAVDPANRVIVPESVGFDPAGLDRRLQPPIAGAWDIWGAYAPASPSLTSSALALAVMTTEVFPTPDARRPFWLVGAEDDLSPDRWVQYYLLTSAFGFAWCFAPQEIIGPEWAALPRLRYRGYLRLGPEVWAFAFTDASGPVIAAWSDSPTRLPASALAPMTEAAALATSATLGGASGSAVDLNGASPMLLLGPRPALVRGLDIGAAHPGTPTRQAALHARPGPDLSALPAVSADYSRTPPELGLYNRALRGFPGGAVREAPRDDRVAVGTHLYSGPGEIARDQPWIYFDVDDSWLYFARGRAPVVVTLEVQAAPEPQMIGFSLYYEAVNGYRYSPWQWVDVGQEWRTYRVALNDVSFTNRDGYDFRINAKGSRRDLWAASVTVEKLAPTRASSVELGLRRLTAVQPVQHGR